MELGLPIVAFFVALEAGLAGFDSSEYLSMILMTLLFTAGGSFFSSQTATVDKEAIRRESGALIREFLSVRVVEILDDSSFGRVSVRFDDGNELTLRWFPLTWIGGNKQSRGIRREVRDALGFSASSVRPRSSILKEGDDILQSTTIVKWRLVLWITVIAIAPFPYLLGNALSGG